MKNLTIETISKTTIAKESDWYLSFPDVVAMPDGSLLCAFRRSDIHYPPTAHLTSLCLTSSYDGGISWSKPHEFAFQPKSHNLWAWHCPRLRLLHDGRIALLCDYCAPPNKLPEIYLSLSSDKGLTWTTPHATGAIGILPDRLLQLNDREWLFTAHWPNTKHSTQKNTLTQTLYASLDAGANWSARSIIAQSPFRNYCEGSLLKLQTGRLQCYLRENSFTGFPTFITHSDDNGHTWSAPTMHPTHAHRPCAGLLEENSVLLTYRNIGSNPGLAAWLGSPDACGYIVSGRDLSNSGALLGNDHLRITNKGSQFEGIQYILMPMDSWESYATIEATVRSLDGSSNSCVMCAGALIRIFPDKLELSHNSQSNKQSDETILGQTTLEHSKFNNISLRYNNRNIDVYVNNQHRIHANITPNSIKHQLSVFFGNSPCKEPWIMDYTHAKGTSEWKSVSANITNSEQTFNWSWHVNSGTFPNSVQRSSITQLSTETSGDWYESGYSGWVKLENQNSIYCVDYERNKEATPYIVGYRLRVT